MLAVVVLPLRLWAEGGRLMRTAELPLDDMTVTADAHREQ